VFHLWQYSGISMSIPVRNLPLVQNWDCHNCGDCCHSLEAVITDEEKRRIEGLGLAGDAEVDPGPWFVRKGWWSGRWALRHRPDGGCVFLTKANRCRLHERFGAEIKPFACRLFPFVLIPAGNHWRVGVRFSCPSAVENKGRPVSEYVGELGRFAQLLEQYEGRSGESAAPPPLQAGQQVDWPDVVRFVDALVKIVENRGDRLERRIRKCLALARICRAARFEDVSGGRLVEFLNVVRAALEDDVPRNIADLLPPSRLGRVLFRTLLAVYARKDRGPLQGPAVRGRWGRLRSGWRFVRGCGRVPRVNTLLPEITFEEVESRPALPAEIDALLERYYLIKLNSLQFCGPPNFGLPFWSGVESLAFTLPAMLWLAKAFTDLPPVQAVQKAILLVDDHFGGNPALGFRHNRFFVRTLAQRGDLEKLIAWYSG
jgi:lysine-N-methylase